MEASLDADSKLIISYLIGGRDAGYADAFMQDVASRLANRVQLTTDGLRAYLDAVEGAFGADVDYAQLIKLYGDAPESAKGRYYHQWLSGQYGLRKLTEHIWMLIGLASACRDMKELRARMAEKFGREGVQITLYLPPPAASSPGGKHRLEGRKSAQVAENTQLTIPGTSEAPT